MRYECGWAKVNLAELWGIQDVVSCDYSQYIMLNNVYFTTDYSAPFKCLPLPKYDIVTLLHWVWHVTDMTIWLSKLYCQLTPKDTVCHRYTRTDTITLAASLNWLWSWGRQGQSSELISPSHKICCQALVQVHTKIQNLQFYCFTNTRIGFFI